MECERYSRGLSSGSGPLTARIVVDGLIRRGAVLPEHREFAVDALDRELRRRTLRLLRRMATRAVPQAIVERKLAA